MITIYSRADVARELGVTAPAVSNYIRRFDNTPRAQFRNPDGVTYWSSAGLADWRRWARDRALKAQVTAAPAGTEVGTNLEVDSKG